MKRYKFELVIEEGHDEFWESIANKTGCDEMLEVVNELLADWDAKVKLVEYTDGD